MLPIIKPISVPEDVIRDAYNLLASFVRPLSDVSHLLSSEIRAVQLRRLIKAMRDARVTAMFLRFLRMRNHRKAMMLSKQFG